MTEVTKRKNGQIRYKSKEETRNIIRQGSMHGRVAGRDVSRCSGKQIFAL